ncbi:hypothetical protein Tco_1129031 [Tanacetum coccineum]
MFLNMDQLEKQLDKDEFQEFRSMAAFRVLETQFQKFIKSRSCLDDDDGLMARKINERQMQKTEGKVDTSKALDANVNDIDIRPIYDEKPIAEVQLTAECNVFVTGQHHTEQLEFNNEGVVDQNAEQCHDTRPLPAKLTDHQTTELSNQSLGIQSSLIMKISVFENQKKQKDQLPQFQKDLLIKTQKAHCIESLEDFTTMQKTIF